MRASCERTIESGARTRNARHQAQDRHCRSSWCVPYIGEIASEQQPESRFDWLDGREESNNGAFPRLILAALIRVVMDIGAGLAGWPVAERRRKRLDRAADAAVMDELFGKANDDNLPMPDMNDETVTALADHHGVQTASELRRADALDDLCDAQFHGDAAAEASIPARCASKGRGQTGLAVAERPAPATVRKAG